MEIPPNLFCALGSARIASAGFTIHQGENSGILHSHPGREESAGITESAGTLVCVGI